MKTNKVWGYELEIVNTDKYCGKILVLNFMYRCSMHMHKIKDETFYINKGSVLLEYGHESRLMAEGDSQRIKPGVLHRFTGINEHNEIIEFSTSHADEDSYRHTASEAVPMEDLQGILVKITPQIKSCCRDCHD